MTFNPRDPAQLDALMELADKATEGPWHILGAKENINDRYKRKHGIR